MKKHTKRVPKKLQYKGAVYVIARDKSAWDELVPGANVGKIIDRGVKDLSAKVNAATNALSYAQGEVEEAEDTLLELEQNLDKKVRLTVSKIRRAMSELAKVLASAVDDNEDLDNAMDALHSVCAPSSMKVLQGVKYKAPVATE